MSTHTDDKRYLSDLTVALRLRRIPGVRIGEIIAEIETHLTESGQSAREAFGAPKEYARQFQPTAAEAKAKGRQWGPVTYLGVITAGFGGWLLAGGVTSGMRGQSEFGLPGWWAAALGTVAILGTSFFVPIDAIIDPRRPHAHRYGRVWFASMVVVSAAAVVVVLAALMWITGG